jgi:hypothetical protein
MTKRITSFFAPTTFVLAVSGSALAADIAVKAPLPAPTPVYSWTGWYVGEISAPALAVPRPTSTPLLSR